MRSPRIRILLSYVVLLLLSSVLVTVAIRGVLLIRLEDQVDDALQQEVLEFERLFQKGRNPRTGEPFTSLHAVFDVFMDRNVPSREEMLMGFVDGRLYRSTQKKFPLKELPGEVVAQWQTLSRQTAPQRAAFVNFDTEVGEGYARVLPVRLRGGSSDRRPGAFAVAVVPVGETGEIRELLRYTIAATLAVLVVASVGAWFVAGRVLAPVRLLTQAANRITESDLTRRIDVRGTDEVADMARTFNAMLDRLDAAFRSQRGFVSDASHELRDPLTVIRGHLELIGGSPDEQRATIALVTDEIDRMTRTVAELQLLADTEHPDFVQPETIDLQPYTEELAAKAAALAGRDWRLEATAGGTLTADRHRLTEAVLNLAHNAVQHSAPDETISLGTARTEDEVRIWVRDNGPGVPRADQERIFERFERGPWRVGGHRGAGLGLSIVRAIAEAHGGRTELESAPGRGATFTIVVPIGPRDGDGVENPDR